MTEQINDSIALQQNFNNFDEKCFIKSFFKENLIVYPQLSIVGLLDFQVIELLIIELLFKHKNCN